MPTVRTAQLFVHSLQNASLNDGQLTEDRLDRLLNPIEEGVDLLDGPNGRDRDLLLSLRLFLAHTTSSQENYEASIDAASIAIPDCKPLHHNAVRKKLEELTGVYAIYDDLCVTSCVAFTGPYAELDSCPVCGEPRFVPGTRDPRNKMTTIPLGPQIQALHRHEQTAQRLDYWAEHTHALLEQLELGQPITEFYDTFCGADVLQLMIDKKLLPDDTVVMVSLDGAQLYRNKKSGCWISIYVVLNFSPDEGRYKVKCVLPGFTVPGPTKPQVMESVLYTMLHHISAVNRHGGLPIWDAYRGSQRYAAACAAQNRPQGDEHYLSGLFTLLGTADAEAMPIWNALVGPTGKIGCRLFCGMPGRRIEGQRGGHYYPMMAKPDDYSLPGCDHDDIDYDNPLPPIDQDAYLALLDQICDPALTEKEYKTLRRETGVAKPSILLGLWVSQERPMILGVPSMCPGDLMHEVMNLASIMLSLWRGTMDCLATDSRDDWDWMVLTGDTWKRHGQDVADCKSSLPTSFERPPRNPAEKLNSGYKAIEFLNYFFVLGPALFYCVLPLVYWLHYCKLVSGMRLLYQRSQSPDHVHAGALLLCEFLQEFESLYIQRREDRMHFMTQVIHNLWHMAPEVIRLGPGTLYSQWTLERTIGNLTEEMKQHSNPYQNLAQRSLRRAQTNALKGLCPDMGHRDKDNRTPRRGHTLRNGYTLLSVRERYPRRLRNDDEYTAICTFLRKHRPPADYEHWTAAPKVRRWGGLQLPNGQRVRSVWAQDKNKSPYKRDTVNVKVYTLSLHQ